MIRPTPLAYEIAREIGENGPMPLDRYMAQCLGDAEHGYYMRRDPLGVAGDFTTAPEISQMFGELVGLWALDMWSKLGAPQPFALIELGPGRGTLMADALRAVGLVPEFAAAAHIHLIETSPVLRRSQQDRLKHAGVRIEWSDDLESVAPGPAIIIANEFFDALPVRQAERARGQWREHMVATDGDGTLKIALGEVVEFEMAGTPAVNGGLGTAGEGDIWEWSPAREQVAASIAVRSIAAPTAALIVDYGHSAPGYGDTLQALARHEPIDVLDQPGQSDLTSHVDFTSLIGAARARGSDCYGPVEMGRFLTAIGIVERAAHLKAGKESAVAEQIEEAYQRLTDPGAMGSLFKVMALTSPGAAAPEPFQRSLATQ